MDHTRDAEQRLAEFTGLAAAIRLEIVSAETVRMRTLRPATYLGGGQVARLSELVEAEELELVLVDAQLSPTQQRNLERELGAKVLDRTGLILEIFGERAATREGVLQVELAHLNYQKGRLVRSWTHLERQRGGGGFLGGPGETQIEADRRQLQERIALLEKRIDKVRKGRREQRKQRQSLPVPVIALVGYTNAGKSTLFNRLTEADVKAEDQLFATLDTTVRRSELPDGTGIVFSDTVGFVSDLPTDLVAAFRATLEEVQEATVVLHVRDMSSATSTAEAADVTRILGELDVTEASVPIIEVWNKIDQLTASRRDDLARLAENAGASGRTICPVSAVTGEGIEALVDAIAAVVGAGRKRAEVRVPAADGKRLAWLHAHCTVLESRATRSGDTVVTVEVPKPEQRRFRDLFPDETLVKTAR